MIRHLAQTLLRRDGKVLLGVKKTGFGAGKLVTPGGKVEPGETPKQAAIRETAEEVGIKVNACEEVAQVIFRDLYYKGQPETDIMHVYVSDDFEGEPTETPELAPEWCSVNDIPYNKMWSDAIHWMPDALRGKKTDSYFRYDEHNELKDYKVNYTPDHCIARFRDKDFGLPEDGDEASFITRTAARAVMFDENGRVALINSTNRGCYKLPGGGIDEGELIEEALRREVHEEAGYEIHDIIPLGYTHETRHKFTQYNVSYAFIARAGKFVGANLMEDEIEDGFQLEWYDDIDAAISALEAIDTSDKIYQMKFFTVRELAILREAKRVMKEKYGQ